MALISCCQKKVFHRDIKPANCILKRIGEERYQLYLADFGEAKHDVKSTVKTKTNAIIGTPPYMAPEMIGNN